VGRKMAKRKEKIKYYKDKINAKRRCREKQVEKTEEEEKEEEKE
jgi:hypothetical protein